MSFFQKLKHSNNNKFSNDKHRKRKIDHISKTNHDVTSSEDEDFFNDVNENGNSNHSTDDEDETPQEKKMRLAKLYLEEIEREEKKRSEDNDVSRDIVSQRLKEDHLKQIGKFEVKIAHKYTAIDESNITVLKCREQRHTITCLCVSSDDNWIFSGSKDGVIVKWCLKSKKKVGIIPFVKSNVDRILGHTSGILSMDVSTDNRFLAVGDSTSEIQIWNPLNLSHIHTLKGHKDAVTDLKFQKNSCILYSTSNDRSVRVWSLDEMSFVETLFGHQDGIAGIDVMHLDKPITAGGRDGTIRLWKISEESQLIFNAQSGSIDAVKMINEKFFVTGGDNGEINVWSSMKKKPLCTEKNAHGCDLSNQQPNWITSLTSLAHSDLIASGSQDGFIRLWQLGDKYRDITKLLEVPITGFMNALAFTSDGKYLVAGCGRDHRLGRWSTIKSAKNSIYLIPLLRDD